MNCLEVSNVGNVDEAKRTGWRWREAAQYVTRAAPGEQRSNCELNKEAINT